MHTYSNDYILSTVMVAAYRELENVVFTILTLLSSWEQHN